MYRTAARGRRAVQGNHTWRAAARSLVGSVPHSALTYAGPWHPWQAVLLVTSDRRRHVYAAPAGYGGLLSGAALMVH